MNRDPEIDLSFFISKWKADKAKQLVEPLPDEYETENIPNPVDRGDESTIWWLDQTISECIDMSNEIVIGLYVYITNEETLNRDSLDLIDKLSLHVAKLPNKEHQALKDEIVIFSQKYGSTVNALKYLDRLIHEIEKDINWVIFCVVIDGEPHIAINTDYRPFTLWDKFYKLYVHYKRNPTYDFATYTVNVQDIQHRFIFVIDGSSDIEISRLFWSGSRRKCILIPTQSLIDILQKDVTRAVIPPEYDFFYKLTNTVGTITYIDERVGRWKDKDTPYPFFELYAEILMIQEKLWKQAFDIRKLMTYTLDDLSKLLKKEDGCDIEIMNNKETTEDELRMAIEPVPICTNLNPMYEKRKYEAFFVGMHQTLFIAKNPKDKYPRATLFASLNNSNEIEIELFCKSMFAPKDSNAARILFTYAIKYFSEIYEYIVLSALPMAIPFYETFGFIKLPGIDEWVLPVQKGKRKIQRLYNYEDSRARAFKPEIRRYI